MRRPILSLIMLCSIMLTSLFSTEARAWYCDGRLCSTDVACCCVSLERQDIRCQGAPSAEKAALCKYGCGCKLVVKAAEPHFASLPSPGIIVSFPMLLPLPPFAAVPPVLSPVLLIPTEARGPPARSIAFVVPSLRAPPVA